MPTTKNIITITTQCDLDEALERRIEKAYLAPDAKVIVRSGDINLIVNSGSPSIKTSGTSSPLIDVWSMSNPHVSANEASSPRIEAWEASSPYVEASGMSSPRLVAQDSSNPRIEVWDRSSPYVEAYGDSTPRVEACGSWIGPCVVPIFLTNRKDLYHVLDTRPNEVEGLRRELVAGRINGSCYEGECSCLLGTLSRCAGVPVDALGIHRDPSRPAEALFAPIRPGMTPDNCPLVAVIVGWIDQWLARRK
jgi:hypothetical protein